MKRTTVMLDDENLARLHLIARRRGTTSSALIREAVGRYVAQAQESAASPLDSLIGVFDGPAEALGAATEEIVAEAVAAKRDRAGHDTRRNRR
jgi:predicted DNA-binding protein